MIIRNYASKFVSRFRLFMFSHDGRTDFSDNYSASKFSFGNNVERAEQIPSKFSTVVLGIAIQRLEAMFVDENVRKSWFLGFRSKIAGEIFFMTCSDDGSDYPCKEIYNHSLIGEKN